MIKHLACIMDGNRRWAKKLDKVPWYGHQEGVESVRCAIQFCLMNSISYLSLYTFSLENLNRPTPEKQILFELIVNEAEKRIDECIRDGIRIRFVGDRSQFPKSIINSCELVERATQDCSRLTVNFLFCYGGRQEILAGVKRIARKLATGELDETQLNEQEFQEYLWMGNIPEPDLIIRTGGFKRLSNFLLYQAAYSEFHFLDCLWPDLKTEHLQQAVDQFITCKRNFGR